MSDWFRRWYVPRAEYLRMADYYELRIAELTQEIGELKAEQSIGNSVSMSRFEVWEYVPPADNSEQSSSNVITVDFRRRLQG